MTDAGTTFGPTTLRVKLTGRSNTALNHAAEMTGDTRTDTVNRALQLYQQLVEAVEDGGRVLISMPDGVERVDVPPAPEQTVRHCLCTCPECHNGCCGTPA